MCESARVKVRGCAGGVWVSALVWVGAVSVVRPARRQRLLGLGDAEAELGRRAEGGALSATEHGAADVLQDQLQRAPDARVRTRARAQCAHTRVEACLSAARPVHDHAWRRSHGGGADTDQIERVGQHCLGRGEQHAQLLRLAASHDRVRGDALDGHFAIQRGALAEDLRRSARRAEEHPLHPELRWRNQREAVRPAAAVHELMCINTLGYSERAQHIWRVVDA